MIAVADLSSGFTPEAFLLIGYGRNAAEVLKSETAILALDFSHSRRR